MKNSGLFCSDIIYSCTFQLQALVDDIYNSLLDRFDQHLLLTKEFDIFRSIFIILLIETVGGNIQIWCLWNVELIPYIFNIKNYFLFSHLGLYCSITNNSNIYIELRYFLLMNSALVKSD